jgi:hypothetical protein
VNYSNRPIYQRRRRVTLLVIGILFLLVVLFLVRACGTGSEQTEQEEVVNAPTVGQTPRAIDEQTVSEGTQDVTVEEKTKE